MKRKRLPFVAILGVFVLAGCQTTTTVSGNKPEDRLNPAMSPDMRSAKLHGHAPSKRN